jgi:preprotein translocase subunit SecG
MYLTLTIFIVIFSVVLILAVLVQNSKGGGLAAGFQSSNQILGVRKTTDFIEKATWSLIGVIVVFSVVAAGIHNTADEAEKADSFIPAVENLQNARQQTPGTAVPGFGEVPEAPAAQPAE